MSVVHEANFKKNALQYVLSAIELDEPVIVSTKTGNAVIINEATFNAWKETLYLKSIPGLAESLIEEAKTPWEECVEIDWKNGLSN
jgi:PHD/YefM family antitoxin component YafN of YafNO toxin-antitoxin module